VVQDFLFGRFFDWKIPHIEEAIGQSLLRRVIKNVNQKIAVSATKN
jgi:hypothetical protein